MATTEFYEVTTIAWSILQQKLMSYVLDHMEGVQVHFMEMGYGIYGFDITAPGSKQLETSKETILKLVKGIESLVQTRPVDNVVDLIFTLKVDMTDAQLEALRNGGKEILEKEYLSKLTIDGNTLIVESLTQLDKNVFLKSLDSI